MKRGLLLVVACVSVAIGFTVGTPPEPAAAETVDEYCPFPDLEGQDPIPVDDAPEAWRSYDADGDGNLTRDDRNALEDRLPLGQVPGAWADWDANGNGVFEDQEASDSFEDSFKEWNGQLKGGCQDNWLRRWEGQHLGSKARDWSATPGKGADLIGSAGDVVSAPGDFVAGKVSEGFEKMVESLAAGADTMIVETITVWTNIPSRTGQQEEVSLALQDDLRLITGLLSGIALVIGAVKMAITGRASGMQTVMFGLLRVLVVGSAGIAGVILALDAGDLYSEWIIDRATAGGTAAGEVALLSAFTGHTGLLFVLAILAIITAIIQIGMLLVRGTAIVMLTGVWQVSAAASALGNNQMWGKVSAWLVAFVVYKPAAATVYAAGFRLLGGGGDTAVEPSILAVVQGVLLLVLAVATLPALIRLIAPMADMGGPSAAGVAAAGAGLAATGAMMGVGGIPAGGGAGGAGITKGHGDASGPPPSAPPGEPTGAPPSPGASHGQQESTPAPTGTDGKGGDVGAAGQNGASGDTPDGTTGAPAAASVGGAISAAGHQLEEAGDMGGPQGPSGTGTDSDSDGPSGAQT